MTKKNAIFILLFVGVALYLNSLFNGFVWDDEEQIVNNSLIHSIGNWPKFFLGGAFYSGGTSNLLGIYYKPFMTLTFSLLYSLFGPNPFFFHLLSITLHLTNSVLVFLLFCYLFGHIGKKINPALPAFAASLVFLVHPIYSEVVFYAANMQDLLYFFFGILALLLAVKPELNIKRATLIFFLLLFSMLSKETGALFAVLIIFYSLLFRRKDITAFFALVATLLGTYLVMRLGIAHIFFSKYEIAPIARISFFDRLTNIPAIIFYYLKTLVFPNNLVPNQHWVISGINFPEFYLPLIISILSFGAIFLFGFFLAKRKSGNLRLYLFFAVWFLLSLLIHLQIFPLDVTASGRWFYLPMVGLLGMAAIVLDHFWPLWKNFRKVLIPVFSFLILILALITFFRSFDWRNGLTLYSHDVLVSKNNFNLENNVGVELFRNGKYEKAEKHFENSVALAPYWWTNWNNLGAIKERNGDVKSAQEFYQKAVDNGEYYLAYENLANLYFNQNKLKEGEVFTQEALKKLPQNPKLWFTLALTQYKLGKKEDALVAAKNAYFLAPSAQTEYVYSRLLNGQSLELK